MNFVEDKKLNLTITELKLMILFIDEFNKKYFDELAQKKEKTDKIKFISQGIFVEIDKKDITKYVGTARKNKFLEILGKQKMFTNFEENKKSYKFEMNKTFARYLLLENKGFVIVTDGIFNLKHKISFWLILISKKYNNLLLAISTFKKLILEDEVRMQHIMEKINLSIKEIKKELNMEIKLTLLNKINNPLKRGEKAEKIFIENRISYEFEIYTKMTIAEMKDMRLIPLQCDDVLYELKKKYGDFELLMFLLSVKEGASKKIINIGNVGKYSIENHLNKMSEITLEEFNKRKKFFYGLSDECKEYHKKAVLKNKRVKEGSDEDLEFYEYYYSMIEIEEKLLGKSIDGESLIYGDKFSKLMKEGKESIKELPFGRMKLVYKEDKVNAIPVPTKKKHDDNEEDTFESAFGW